MPEPKTATGIRVRIAPDRLIPIDGDTAEMLRGMAMEQGVTLFDQIQARWERLDTDGIRDGRKPTEEERETFGSIFWLLGEARDRFNDLLYITDTYDPSQHTAVKTDPTAHEFAGHSR
jgi:hypothetical protein